MRIALLLASLLVGAAVAVAPTASAGPVGLVDDACDDLHPAVECLLSCQELFLQLYLCYVVDDLPPSLVAPHASGPVGLVDHVCDTAVGPLGAECVLECDHISPLLEGFCQRLEYGGSVWYQCRSLLGSVPACDPDTYKCASMDPLLDAVCREVLNPTLDRL